MFVSKKTSCVLVLFAAWTASNGGTSLAQPPSAVRPPAWSRVKECVETHLVSLGLVEGNALVTRGDIMPVLKQLELQGWHGLTGSELVERLMDDGEFLARELRSSPGRAFLKRLGDDRLIYDRLDRVARMPGGQALIHDLIRLPDGHRYAKRNPPRGVPSLTELLPKGASGKTPRVPDLDKPTGRIYTVEQLWQSLETAHQTAQVAANSP